MNIGDIYKIKENTNQPWFLVSDPKHISMASPNDDNIINHRGELFTIVSKKHFTESHMKTTDEFEIQILIDNKILYTVISDKWFETLMEKIGE